MKHRKTTQNCDKVTWKTPILLKWTKKVVWSSRDIQIKNNLFLTHFV